MAEEWGAWKGRWRQGVKNLREMCPVTLGRGNPAEMG